MVKLTRSLEEWLWRNYKEKFALIKFGHTELLTEEMKEEYIKWCTTEDGKKYLKGGSEYGEPR